MEHFCVITEIAATNATSQRLLECRRELCNVSFIACDCCNVAFIAWDCCDIAEIAKRKICNCLSS